MEYEEKEVYLFLDFKGALPPATFRRKKLFFKMINLDKDDPIVQLDETLYRGTYIDAVGTNVFFEETDEMPEEDSIERSTPIKLKYLLKQDKVLELKRIKLPEDFIPIKKEDYVKLKFRSDYRQILDKIVNGTFRIDDYIVDADAESDSDEEQEYIPQTEENKEQSQEMVSQVTEERVKHEKGDYNNKAIKKEPKEKDNKINEEKHDKSKVEKKRESKTDKLDRKMDVKVKESRCASNEGVLSIKNYDSKEEQSNLGDIMEMEQLPSTHDSEVANKMTILKQLAEQPPRILSDNDEFHIADGIVSGTNPNFFLIKDLILQDIACEELSLEVNEDNLSDFVDIESSINQGIVELSNEIPRKFTDAEMRALLNINNFENLKVFAKLFVLLDYLKVEKQYLNDLPEHELTKVDSFGRTPLQRHEMLKGFANEIAHQIAKKIKNREVDLDSGDSLEDLEKI